MRTVFDNYEIFHIFAQQTQSEGKNYSRNIFFKDNKIYSYGYHYLLGKFITNKQGETAIIINDKGYSNTTSKHIWRLQGATSQYKQFFTSSTDTDTVLRKLNELKDKTAKARKPEMYINEANSLFDRYEKFVKWNNLKIDKNIKKAYKFFQSEDIKSAILKRKEEILKDKKKKELKEQKEFNKSLKDFTTHKTNYIYNNYTGEDFVRISEDKTQIETSKGVRVDIDEAQKLYTLIKHGRDIKGYQIDNYTVISLNGTLTIGCHKINTKNMHEVGAKILTLKP